MKKIKQILFVGTMLATSLAHAQLSPTENYVYSKTILDYDANNQATKISETVQYFDGLGRPKQVVNVKASPTGKDVVTPIEYDGFGRQVKDYLPIPQGQTLNGGIVSNPLANVINTPYGQEKIYAEKTLENSPLDRLLEQKQVGTAWNDKPVRFQYDANIHEDYVRKYKPTTIWDPAGKMTVTTLELLEYFLPNTLYKNTVTDEDGNKTIEFKNGRGQVVLVRKVISSTENADTYYVYNEYDQLAFVIPPGSPATPDDTALNNFCYQYRYDGKNRLVEKKLPGKGWEFMVYDKADRVVLTRDANLEAKGQWLFTKYDQFSRAVYTGILDSYPGRSAQAATVEGFSSSNEVRSSSSFNNSGMDIYYTNSTYPQSNFRLLSVNYYDTYPLYSFNPAFPANVFAQPVLTDNATGSNISTKGLPVISLVKNIEDDNWTKNYTYYNNKGRVISTHSINHLGGFTRTSSDLNFSGIAKQTLVRHKRLATDTERSIREVFTYDNQNRLLTHTHQVGTGTIEYLAQNKYNELSQLEWKKVGGVSTTTPLQQVDYKYNIRGWMTQINDPTNLGSDLFGYVIRYNDPIDLTGQAGFNGNITEIDWSTKSDNTLRRYDYYYDTLNRFNFAQYAKPNLSVPQTGSYSEWTTYDLNGNIKTMGRYGNQDTNTPILIDQLQYTYFGNRLLSIKDISQNLSGYPYLTPPNVIDYDLNGNMISHKDKGLALIVYNFLNLPTKINGTAGKKQVNTSNIYRSDGIKLSKTLTTTDDTSTTDYIDGFQYKFYTGPFTPTTPNGLQFIPTSEGYYDFSNNSYIYNYTDHLGNIRVGYKKSISGVEIIEENNYYPFGLRHEGYNNLAGNPYYYQYKYNGKELQTETGMYDYGARMYMPDLGRWGVVDPLTETSRRWSPYNYTYNNPIRFIDPDGKEGKDWYQNNLTQNIEWHDGSTERAGQTNLSQKANGGSIAIIGGGIINILNTDGSITKNGETITNGFSTTTSLGRTITSRQPWEALVNADGNGGLNWDNDVIRGFTGDFVNIGVGYSGIAVGGGGTSFEANWVIHGPEASILPAITTTPSIGGGYNSGATINIGNANYLGNANDINRGMLITNTAKGDDPTDWVSVGGAFGGKAAFTGTLTKVSNGNQILGGQMNIGVGAPAGPVPVNAAAGYSNTYMIKDFGAKTKK